MISYQITLLLTSTYPLSNRTECLEFLDMSLLLLLTYQVIHRAWFQGVIIQNIPSIHKFLSTTDLGAFPVVTSLASFWIEHLSGNSLWVKIEIYVYRQWQHYMSILRYLLYNTKSLPLFFNAKHSFNGDLTSIYNIQTMTSSFHVHIPINFRLMIFIYFLWFLWPKYKFILYKNILGKLQACRKN